MMKKSSMKTAPKGRMPPMSIVKCGPMYHACAGICLGISLVRTGGSRRLCLKPKKAPQKTRGTEMQNHMQMSAMIVPKGTAPDEPRPQMKKLRKSAPTKTMPGQG